MLSPGLAASGHISSGSPTWGGLIPDVGRVPHLGKIVESSGYDRHEGKTSKQLKCI